MGLERTRVAEWLRLLTTDHKDNTNEMGLSYNTHLKCSERHLYWGFYQSICYICLGFFPIKWFKSEYC